MMWEKKTEILLFSLKSNNISRDAPRLQNHLADNDDAKCLQSDYEC